MHNEFKRVSESFNGVSEKFVVINKKLEKQNEIIDVYKRQR